MVVFKMNSMLYIIKSHFLPSVESRVTIFRLFGFRFRSMQEALKSRGIVKLECQASSAKENRDLNTNKTHRIVIDSVNIFSKYFLHNIINAHPLICHTVVLILSCSCNSVKFVRAPKIYHSIFENSSKFGNRECCLVSTT